MEQFTATLYGPDGSILAVGLAVLMEYTPGGPVFDWFGVFRVSADAGVEAGRTYRLVAADGRAGAIVVSQMSGGTDRRKVVFAVIGEFGA